MKLIIVSNRLPVTVQDDDGKITVSKSGGGLVTGISAYLKEMNTAMPENAGHQWIGWPGSSIMEKRKPAVKEILLKEKLNAVFIQEKIMDKFYYGFCNKTIWPLFHCFPAYTSFDPEFWDTYKFVNEQFCEEVCRHIHRDNTVWIHDYHLMLLPGLIRKRIKDAKIGFFLHIPFPHFEIFRLLPQDWRKEILEGLIGADLIGFHTNDYTKYFLGSVLRLLGYDNNQGEIQLEDRIINVDTFPMGIDYEKYRKLADSESVTEECNKIRRDYQGQKIILSIDRLDYTKGILNRMQGYHEFLEKNPEWSGKITMIAVTVPSRIGVDKYNQMKRNIDEIVGKINGTFGTLIWTPIIYQYRSFHDEHLSALYKASDIALITPLRDGMNLIAKEYMASRSDNKGVLILSEMAGASKEMIETVIINPNHIEDIASAIKKSLEIDENEQISRNRIIRKRLRKNNVMHWADSFLISLIDIKNKQKLFEKKYLDIKIRKVLTDSFKQAKKKIIFLDYDGTLKHFYDEPKHAEPDKELINLLNTLAGQSGNHVVLVSGRDYKTMDEWFWEVNASLVAEHGIWIKKRGKNWKIAKKINNEWKASILPMMNNYSDLIAGSFTEEKDYSLVWHYRKTDKIHGEIIANELTENLIDRTANMNLQVLRGSKVIEVRNADINKGTAVMDFQPDKNYDFILCIGDDWTDEDMFKTLPRNSYTIKVGMAKSYSRYNLNDSGEVRTLLKELINE
jgi:trehalose 6-phosphate synthase/phosphatase